MSVIKKGSKGNPVKELQTLLNKTGTKPPLKVDGDFGTKTDKAVRTFQKRAKLKTDGKAGDFTLAAVQFGGPLPEMNVQDYKKWWQTYSGKVITNDSTLERFGNIQAEVKKLSSVLDKHIPIADKLISDNTKHVRTVYKLATGLIDKQKKFDDVLLKSPQTAEKLLKECIDLDKKAQSLLEGTLKPTVRKASRETGAAADQIIASLAKIDANVRDLKALAKGRYV